MTSRCGVLPALACLRGTPRVPAAVVLLTSGSSLAERLKSLSGTHHFDTDDGLRSSSVTGIALFRTSAPGSVGRARRGCPGLLSTMMTLPSALGPQRTTSVLDIASDGYAPLNLSSGSHPSRCFAFSQFTISPV